MSVTIVWIVTGTVVVFGISTFRDDLF
jgi:hypothetical protein